MSTFIPPIHDPFIKSMQRALISKERTQLKANIKADGRILKPYVVWKETNKLVDGHHRDELVAELLAESVTIAVPDFDYRSFADLAAVMKFVIDTQDGQRNLTEADRISAVLKNEDLVLQIQKEAAARQQAGEKANDDQAKGSTNKKLGRIAGVGETSMKKGRKIWESGNADIIRRTFSPADETERFSLGEAERQLTAGLRAAKKAKLVAHAKNIVLAPLDPYETMIDKIHTADSTIALKLIPDGTVTFTVTSPPYFLTEIIYENSMANFTTVEARMKMLKAVFTEVYRATRRGGRCMINIDPNNTRDTQGDKVLPVMLMILQMMHDIGWKFYGEICWYKQHCVGKHALGSVASPRSYNINRQHEYLLVFFKESPELDGDSSLNDLTSQEAAVFQMSQWYIRAAHRQDVDHPDFHPCPYHEELAYRAILLNSYVGDVILDPFNGSGTTTFVAAAMGRRFIGMDLGPSYCEAARRRIASLEGLSPAEKRAKIDRFIVGIEERADGWGKRKHPKGAGCKPKVQLKLDEDNDGDAVPVAA